MSKGERISRFVQALGQPGAGAELPGDIARNKYYCGFFHCWNKQQYYEAHDVLEHLWLNTGSEDARYFKGLIQAAGAFVHLRKQFEQPTHPKHGRRLAPALRLLRLADENLAPFAPTRHAFDVAAFRRILHEHACFIAESQNNPWSPENAPQLSLLLSGGK